MTIYKVTAADFAPVVFDSLAAAMDDVSMHLGEGVEWVDIQRGEMTQEEFDSLKEHQGY
jgi:hypothetical protein